MQELHLPRVSDVVFAYFPARITALNGTSNGETYLAPNGNKVQRLLETHHFQIKDI